MFLILTNIQRHQIQLFCRIFLVKIHVCNYILNFIYVYGIQFRAFDGYEDQKQLETEYNNFEGNAKAVPKKLRVLQVEI